MPSTLDFIREILQQYGGLESNVPVNHPYWKLLDKQRAGILDATLEAFDEGPLYSPKAPPSGTPGQIQAKLSATRNQIRSILNSFGGRETNIPFTNDYWFLQNVARSLERELAEIRA